MAVSPESPNPDSNSDSNLGRKSGGLALHWQIAIALMLAVLTGLFLPTQIASVDTREVLDFIGKLFLQALKMLVVPLIFSAIVSAVAKLGEEDAFGRLGIKTISYYALTTALAVGVGLICVNIIKPGTVSKEVSEKMIASASVDGAPHLKAAEGKGLQDIVAILQRMVPENIVETATKNDQMLGIICFSILFGFFITKLPASRRDRFAAWWDDAYETMIAMTDWVIRFTPYGVFALVSATVMDTGGSAFLPLLRFFFCVVLALAVHMFVVMPVVLLMFGIPPFRHFRAMSPALLTALSTASSAATIPLSLECAQKNAGVSSRISSFTIPLGATVNMNGTALYECTVVFFIAQIYGIDLSLGAQFTVVLFALVTYIGVAGIPSASLVAIVIILNAVGLPAEAIGMVMAVDRILDMCRTSVNVFGDTCSAAIIARTEGEKLYTP
ncbi:MAG: dicarboxylate/amino acid:cation symporter [Chthoniobacterales bacterium]